MYGVKYLGMVVIIGLWGEDGKEERLIWGNIEVIDLISEKEVKLKVMWNGFNVIVEVENKDKLEIWKEVIKEKEKVKIEKFVVF